MRHSFIFYFCISALLVSSCSDDSTSLIPLPPADETPDTPEPVYGDIGDACTDTASCKTGLICQDEHCIELMSIGQVCDKWHLCTPPGVCKSGRCSNPESGEGERCDAQHPCKQPFECIESLCRQNVGLGDICHETAVCAEGICDTDGICRRYEIEGAPCDFKNILCREGMKCSEFTGTCYTPGGLGDTCSVLNDTCDEGYICDYTTSQCMTAGTLGEPCGEDILVTCGFFTGMLCIDGKCRQPVSGNAECDDNHPCADAEYFCSAHKCVQIESCTTDTDCQADRYCCIGEGCPVQNACLNYGEGPRGDTNDACLYQTVPGLFEADIQCEWLPSADDPYPEAASIVTPAFVGKMPHEALGTSQAVVFLSYKPGIWTPVDEAYQFGVIRILNPETCQIVENIYDKNHYVSAGATLTLGDVDGDGIPEIFAQRSTYQPDNKTVATGGIVAFKWSDAEKKYMVSWFKTSELKNRNYKWGGLGLHDINNDGIPEVLNATGEALNAQTGEKLNGDQIVGDTGNNTTLFPAIEDLDNDGKVEMIVKGGNVYEWQIEKDPDGNIVSQKWVLEYSVLSGQGAFWLKAIGDFGTVGDIPADFDWSKPDGIAEIVSTTGNESTTGQVGIHALHVKKNEDGTETKTVQRILYMGKKFGGGAPTVGDFDGDKLPEVGIAFGDYYAVIDPQCQKDANGVLPEGCAEENILWKQPNTDNSSYTTGSSVFDFDADGIIEVVYADECYTRIYNGKTGDVLFSARQSSRTAFEMPTIADVDNDESAEILMGANRTDRTCPKIDTIHRGIRCQHNDDCTSKTCEDGFCRCSADNECNWRKGADGKIKNEYVCVEPLANDKAINSHKVCRAQRPQNQPFQGLRIMRDRYDRWASSRNVWNQFAYSIQNIHDDMSIPQTAHWIANFLTPGLNNYRANSQGKIGMNAAPDITGKLNKDNLCGRDKESNKITLTGVICNRGTKMVASKMPASFYEVLEDGSLGQKFCTAYTAANVPVGDCLDVSCELDDIPIGIQVRMISNDDGEGGRTTVECNENNNTDEVTLEACQTIVN
ncbi:MAG: VCBS repeat-containing protein [Proteobacteria bacterium]|nr:VCBS repeat-containing protein [Pseudomonadota bacterium]